MKHNLFGKKYQQKKPPIKMKKKYQILFWHLQLMNLRFVFDRSVLIQRKKYFTVEQVR